MSWATARAALKTRLEAITGIGMVHSYRRYTRGNETSPEFRELFYKGSRLHAWQFSRTLRRAEPSGSDDSRRVVQHEVEVEAFYAMSDADESEHALQDLVDTVATDLETGDRTLGGAVLTHSLFAVEQIGAVDFFGVLCNYARAKMILEEVV